MQPARQAWEEGFTRRLQNHAIQVKSVGYRQTILVSGADCLLEGQVWSVTFEEALDPFLICLATQDYRRERSAGKIDPVRIELHGRPRGSLRNADQAILLFVRPRVRFG